MKKICKFIKSNFKVVIAFIIGIIVSGTGVYATTIIFQSNQVGYDNTNTNLTLNNQSVNNVQDAIDAIYTKTNGLQTQLNTCTGSLTTAQNNYSTCSSSLSTAQSNYSTCSSSLSTCNSNYSTCSTNLTNKTNQYNTCSSNLTTAQNNYSTCSTNLTNKTNQYNTCSSNLSTCTGNLTTAQANEFLTKYKTMSGTPQYYAWNATPTSSTSKGSHKVYLAKWSDYQLGVCINSSGTQYCFRYNNYFGEKEHIKEVFGASNCSVNSAYVYCNASGFDCSVNSDGRVNCYDRSTYEGCTVDGDGYLECG